VKALRNTAIAASTALLLPLAVELSIQLAGDPRVAELTQRAAEGPQYWELARAGILVPDDRELRFRLTPGFSATVGGIEYRVNELGLRGGPVARARPAGARRVLVAGDSYAFGLGVSEGDALPRQLEALLREASPRGAEATGAASGGGAGGGGEPATVEVINFGVPAYQTGQQLALLRRLGFDLEPDMVVLLYYANDNVEAALTLAPSIRSLYVDELPIPHAWKSFLSRSYLYSRIAQLDASRRGSRGEFETRGERNWPVTAARLRAFAAACREHGAAFLLAPLPELSGGKEIADDASPVALDHARVLALARSEGWPAIDLRAGLLKRVRAIEKYFLSIRPMDSHLNADGHRAVAQLIAPEVERLLAAAQRR
jgi:hypothetical protein